MVTTVETSIINDCEALFLGILHEPMLSTHMNRMFGSSNNISCYTTSQFTSSNDYRFYRSLSTILAFMLIICPILSIALIGNIHIPQASLVLASLSSLLTFIVTLMACHNILRRLSSNDMRCSSLTFPGPSLWSIFQLYGMNVISFALLYLSLLHDKPGSIRGVVGNEAGLLAQLIECLYFSFSIQATAGFGDCHAASTIARAAVSLQLCSGMTVQAVLVGKGIDLVTYQRRQSERTH